MEGWLLWGGAEGAEQQQVKLAHPCPALHKEIQHVLAHLVVVLV